MNEPNDPESPEAARVLDEAVAVVGDGVGEGASPGLNRREGRASRVRFSVGSQAKPKRGARRTRDKGHGGHGEGREWEEVGSEGPRWRSSDFMTGGPVGIAFGGGVI